MISLPQLRRDRNHRCGGVSHNKTLSGVKHKLMALIANGGKLIRDLEKSGALGFYVPLEGGFEGRYQRRLRAAGYVTVHMSAKGLGDLSSYLTGVHGIRPPHLGKKDIRTYFVPPIVNYQLEHMPTHAKGLVLWLIEGHILSREEVEFLALLPTLEPRVKVVLERGGDRVCRWQPLQETLVPA
jgi:NAD(P)H-quinone oxidoreductase subunit N